MIIKQLHYNQQKGYVISMVVFFILIAMMSMAISAAALIANQQISLTKVVTAGQAYYAAESGIEDALLRLRNNATMSALSYTMTVNGITTTVTIPNILAGSRALTSQAIKNNLYKTIGVSYGFTSQGIDFHYGAQVGAGGLDMDNGSRIIGNVFSNGNITGSSSGTIDYSAIVAGNGNYLSGPRVNGNALAYSCLSPTQVGGSLTYVTGGTRTCTVTGTTTTQATEIGAQPLPVLQAQIDSWIAQANSGTTYTGNYTVANNTTVTLGPQKITGNLTVGNSATLILSGTLYVQGNISLASTSTVRLSSSYGPLGGVLIAGGTIDTGGNNSVLTGSGQTSSYLLIISTSSADPAITLQNNAGTANAVFHASAGTVVINNNVSVKEVTGYRVRMGNNATIQYDVGLQDAFFSDGPVGSWKVNSWLEQ